MPRMKDYSYILVLIPSLFVIRDLGKHEIPQNWLLLAIGLMIFAQPQQTNVPGLQSLIYMLQAYLPLLMAAGIMVYVLETIARTARESQPFRASGEQTAPVPVGET